MKFGVLVSTMNQSDYTLIQRMNIKDNAIIINQTSNKLPENTKDSIQWINIDERGLSKSRNLALQKCDFDYALFADDDLEYVSNLSDIIKESFLKYPDYDILTFQVFAKEGVFKKYTSKFKNIGYIRSMKKASVEIAVNCKSIKDKNIHFNENFGSGSKYQMGEDNIFLYDCLRKGLKIGYVPIKIAELEMGESTWFRGYNKEYFRDLGAIYTEMSYPFSYILMLQFALRKFKLYADELKMTDALKEMLNGRREYLNQHRRRT